MFFSVNIIKCLLAFCLLRRFIRKSYKEFQTVWRCRDNPRSAFETLTVIVEAQCRVTYSIQQLARLYIPMQQVLPNLKTDQLLASLSMGICRLTNRRYRRFFKNKIVVFVSEIFGDNI